MSEWQAKSISASCVSILGVSNLVLIRLCLQALLLYHLENQSDIAKFMLIR